MFVSPASWAAATDDVARIAALETKVQELVDREAVRQVVLTYARTIDARDWSTHRALFTDQIEMEDPSANGQIRVRALDEVMAGKQRFFMRLQATQHIANTLLTELDQDQAHLVTQLYAQHYLPNPYGEPIQRMIGTYDMWLKRTSQGWKIYKYTHNTAWNEGNGYIYSPRPLTR